MAAIIFGVLLAFGVIRIHQGRLGTSTKRFTIAPRICAGCCVITPLF
jgi:hypothetical protein